MTVIDLPKTPRSWDGFAGFILAALSAAASGTAILSWIYMARNITHPAEGGAAFAVNIGPLMFTIVGIALGGLSLLVTCSSLFLFWKGLRRTFTFYHFCALLFLSPAAFLLANMIFQMIQL